MYKRIYVQMHWSANVLKCKRIDVQMYLRQSGSWGSAVRDRFDINGCKRRWREGPFVKLYLEEGLIWQYDEE